MDLHKVFSGSYTVLMCVEQELKSSLKDFTVLQVVILFD